MKPTNGSDSKSPIFVNVETGMKEWFLIRPNEQLQVVGAVLTLLFLTAHDAGWSPRDFFEVRGEATHITLRNFTFSNSEAHELSAALRPKIPSSANEHSKEFAMVQSAIQFFGRGGFKLERASPSAQQHTPQQKGFAGLSLLASESSFDEDNLDDSQNRITPSALLPQSPLKTLSPTRDATKTNTESPFGVNSNFSSLPSTLTPELRAAQTAAKQEKNEVTINQIKCSVDANGISYGETHFPVHEIEGIRWGAYSRPGHESSVKYMFVITSSDKEQLVIEWNALRDDETQSSAFKKIVFWINKFVSSTLIKAFKLKLHQGGTVAIGPLKCNKDGVVLNVIGLLGHKDILCPWSRLKTDIYNGSITLTDGSSSKFHAVLDLSEIDNAFMLHNLS